MSRDWTTFRARWIFPGTALPIRDGVIAVDAAGPLTWVGPASESPRPVDRDLGAVAILPGFVNAHTHLELGPLPGDGGRAGPEDEIAWLGRVIAARADRSPTETDALIRRNLAGALAAGTTTLADITTAGQSWDAVAGAPVWGTVFAEVIGLTRDRSRATWRDAFGWYVARQQAGEGPTRFGLSPHAPYSTAGWLYYNAAASGLPLTTHLGEMPAERAFLRDRAGPLRHFVEGLGAWTDDWQPLGHSPVDYAASSPLLDQPDWIVAHGNIFEANEFCRLVADRANPAARRVAVAYCPRTHARFGHPPHPFRAMLDAGVVVCLGTDSRASAPSLSILDEVRFLHRHHPDIPGSTLLAMATIHGAWALRRDDATGSLAPGKSADLTLLPIAPDSPRSDADPHALWLDHDAPPLGTMFRGRWLAVGPV